METFDRAPESAIDHALTLRENGDIESAITFLFKAVGESLMDRGLVITLAKMLSETGKLERAEHWFRHALKIAPDDLDVQLGYGTFLAETGRFAESRVRLEVALNRAQELRDDSNGFDGFVLAVELNLARVCFQLGDTTAARALVTPWLADEDGWFGAHDVFVDVANQLGLDPTELDEEGLASGHVSPYMVCHRLQGCLMAEPPDLLGFERVVARADEIFDFDWRRCADEITGVLAQGRKAAVHAIMRGELAADLVEAMLSQGRAPEIAETDGVDEDDGEQDDVESPDDGLEQLIRLAGWSDYESGVEICLMRRAGHFFIVTTNQDAPIELDASVAGWLMSIFARAVAGFQPTSSPSPVPVDRNWLVEGLGCSKQVCFNRFSHDGWPLVHAAITICQVESTLRSSFPVLNPPFSALVMAVSPMVANHQGLSTEDGLIEIRACLTADGFVFARMPKIGAPTPTPDEFFDRASPDLLSLLPEIEFSFPCFVHPVAAWALFGHVWAMKTAERGSFRDDWVSYCSKPVQVSGYIASRDFDELGL